MDDVKTGVRWRAPGRARLCGKGHVKVNMAKSTEAGRQNRAISGLWRSKLPLSGTRGTSTAERTIGR